MCSLILSLCLPFPSFKNFGPNFCLSLFSLCLSSALLNIPLFLVWFHHLFHAVCVCVQLMSLFGKKCDFGFSSILYEYFVSLLLYIYVFSRFAMIQSSSFFGLRRLNDREFFLFWLHWAKVVWEGVDRVWCRILLCFFFRLQK